MQILIRFTVALVIATFANPGPSSLSAQYDNFHINDTGKSVIVKIGQDHFTTYDYSSHAKPIFYPLMGPKQIAMTRNHPMKTVDGEQKDHPHHKSMWIGHEISDVDFWSEKGGRVKLTDIKVEESNASFLANHEWLKNDTDEIVMRDQFTARFSQKPNARIIDVNVEFLPAKKLVKFVDTKEGFFALRVHPNLRGKPVSDSSPRGIMTNSNGQSGKGIWGKKARWVDYSGEINSTDCGITVMDHPSNFRHPTTWHARDYGLLAANPFGLHYFQKKTKRAGEYELKPGNSLKLKYRVVLHAGNWGKNNTESLFREFAKQNH